LAALVFDPFSMDKETRDHDAHHVVLLLHTFDKQTCSLPWAAGRHSAVLRSMCEDSRERAETIPLSPSFCTQAPVEFVCNFLRLQDALQRVIDYQAAAKPPSDLSLGGRDRPVPSPPNLLAMLPRESCKELSGATLLSVLKTTHFLDVEMLFHQALREVMLRITSSSPTISKLSDECMRDAFVVDALIVLLTTTVSQCQYDVWRTTPSSTDYLRSSCTCRENPTAHLTSLLCNHCAFGQEGPLACLALLVIWGYHLDERLTDIFLSERVLANDLSKGQDRALALGQRGTIWDPDSVSATAPRLRTPYQLRWGNYRESLEYLIHSLTHAEKLGADCVCSRFFKMIDSCGSGEGGLTHKRRLLVLLLRVVLREHEQVLATSPCAWCLVTPGVFEGKRDPRPACSHCKAKRYCNDACKQKHWNVSHRTECWSLYPIDSAFLTSAAKDGQSLSSGASSPRSGRRVCVSKYMEQALELFLSGDVLELVAKDLGTETGRHLCAIYQVSVQTLDRQEKLLALLAAPPSAAVCVAVFECLVGSRTLLVDWRVDKTAAHRVRHMCSQLTHALAFLKRKAATDDFATALEICTRSCLFSIIGPSRWPRMPSEPYHPTISLFSNSPTCMWESFLRDVYTGELNTCGDSADCCYWVKATVTFVSDNIEEESEVPKDSIGKVVEVDDDDASLLSGVRIDFGDIGKHWVSKEHFDNICALSQETREGCKHPTGDGGAQLLTAQVLTAHMLHGNFTVSFHTGLRYDTFSNLNTSNLNMTFSNLKTSQISRPHSTTTDGRGSRPAHRGERLACMYLGATKSVNVYAPRMRFTVWHGCFNLFHSPLTTASTLGVHFTMLDYRPRLMMQE